MIGPASLIQSSFGGNLEAVLAEGPRLVHWWATHGLNRDGDPVFGWQRGATISDHATGPGSIIQSRIGSPGNFEVVALEGTRLVHYWKDNSDVHHPWRPGGLISDRATGPACIIESNIGSPGNFEVVVPEGSRLVHYWKDNGDVHHPWQMGGVISDRATGPGCIIQSNIGSPGNFEVVVLEGRRLVHCWKDNSDLRNPWRSGGVIADGVDGPGAIVQGRISRPGNFEVIAPVGHRLAHWWKDNSDLHNPWRPGYLITTSVRGPGCIGQSAFGATGHFEVLVGECWQSIVHYWHDNSGTFPWTRAGVLVGEPVPEPMPDVIKRGQLTGELDRHIGAPALNRTESRFGIRGTDLGSSFLHGGRSYFLFGDTARTAVPEPPKPGLNEFQRQNLLDSIAWSTDTDAEEGLSLTFNPQHPLVPGVSQVEFEIPCEGLSAGSAMYVWFTTDHSLRKTMGRTVLARSTDDGQNFDSLYTFSTDKFINVSIERVRNSSLPGLPDSDGDGLLIFGSGRYRASDVHLAYLPLDALDDGSKSRLRFWTLGGWRDDEGAADPLFCAGCVGEFNVRWSFHLDCWTTLYNSDNPPVVVLRTAPQPWGPWSEPRTLFDPWRSGGYCHFMHRGPTPNGAPPCDRVEDDMFQPGKFRSDEWAGAYGPYQITPLSTGVRRRYSKIYFTLSTWNPYNVMLMSAVVTPEGGPVDTSAYADDANAANDRKYARLSVLQARIADAHRMHWDNGGQAILSAPDHLAWAQVRPRHELRNELKAKFAQLLARIPETGNRADAYAQISVTAARLGADGPYDTTDYQAHNAWAVRAIAEGHFQWLSSEMDARLDRPGLFRQSDDWCNANGRDAANEQKYARVSMLLARLAAQRGVTWDWPGQGSLEPFAHLRWARLHPLHELLVF